MAVIRAVAIAIVLLFAFLVAAPVQWMLGVMRLPGWGVLPRYLCRAILVLLGIRVQQSGSVPDGGARLLVANHVSWIDALVLESREPLCFLAKKEVADWPVVGVLARVTGTVFIDRSRRRAILPANREMASRLAQGRSVLLFPEGTTHDGVRRGRFLTSHLACLRDVDDTGGASSPARVQPVGISYSRPVAAWVGEATLVPHVWAVLCAGGLTCRLNYGTVRAMTPGFDRKLLGRHLAQEVESLIGPQERRAEPETAVPDLAPPSVVAR